MTDTDQATTAADHVAAAKELKRLLFSVRHLAALGDKIETWAGIERTIAETDARLGVLAQKEEQARANIDTLQRISNLEKAETMARSSLADVKSEEAAATMKLADLNEQVKASASKLADLDKQVTTKAAELSEIEAALAVWKQKLAG